MVFSGDYTAAGASGTAARSGIIDEFGTLFADANPTDISNLDPGIMATIFFEAVAPGVATVTGGPADSFPFGETLVFGNDDPVPVDRIRYDSLQITVTAGTAAVLQNLELPADVNADGFVSARDALIVVNRLREQRAAGESPSQEQFYPDVNGDGRISAGDALGVLLHVTESRAAAAESILPPESSDSSDGQSSNDSSDPVFADLGVATPAVDASGNDSGSSVVSPQLAATNDADDENEDELLGLLADDVSGQWS